LAGERDFELTADRNIPDLHTSGAGSWYEQRCCCWGWWWRCCQRHENAHYVIEYR